MPQVKLTQESNYKAFADFKLPFGFSALADFPMNR